MYSLFRYQRLCPEIIRINGLLGYTNEFFYLVTGSRKAALIDTGYGIGDLAAFVRTWTKLPVTVLNTHGHHDHTGGNVQFDEIYICPEDMEFLQEPYCPERIDEMARRTLEDHGVWVGSDAVFAPPLRQTEARPIYDGDVFDLGGITLEAITMPGHSGGCVSFLYREARILFSGDNCGPQPLLMVGGTAGSHRKYSSRSLETYGKSLKKLAAREGEFDRILNCHKTGELPLSCFHGVMDAVDGVLCGKYPGIPTAVHKGTVTGVFSARGLDPENILSAPDGFSGDVIFAKDNIWDNQQQGGPA